MLLVISIIICLLPIRIGKIFLFWNGCRAELVVTELKLVKEFLSSSQSYTRTDADKYMKKIIGDGIAACEGEKWVKLRKVANQSFHAENLKVTFRFCKYEYNDSSC